MMQAIKISLIISFILLFFNPSFSQKTNIWLTYSQSKFIYSPGIEANYFFNRYIGLQLGVNVYSPKYDPTQIVNVTDESLLDFYSANLGFCSIVLNRGDSKLGVTVGFEINYGPEFKILRYYTSGGYNLYFDASTLDASFGIDFGVFYSFKRLTGILKFSTARKKIRLGVGYSFGSFNAG